MRQYRLRRRDLFTTVAVAVLITLMACTSKPRVPTVDSQPNDANTLRRGIGGEPASLDPAKAVDSFSFEILRDLYEGLTAETPGGAVIPGVASSWTISADGTEYVFHLRSNARWSNGQPVIAEDFVRAWKRVVDPKTASPVADILRPIKGASEIIDGDLPPERLGVRATRQDELIVNLAEPTPYFVQVLTHSATFPIFSGTAEERATLVSNGAYSLAQWIPGTEVRIRKNPYYWDRDNVRISNVNYFPIPDESAELRRYESNELDLTQSVPAADLPSLRHQRPGELFVAPFLGVAYYALNLKSPTLRDNKGLRIALALAIDRETLEDSIFAYGQRAAFGFVPPGTWNYGSQKWDWSITGKIERENEARRQYALAGFTSSNKAHLRILYNTNPAIKHLTIAIASMWREVLGVETELTEEEYRVFLESRRDPLRWDIARLGWTADYNDAGNFLDIFRSSSPNNDARYSNARYDELLKNAAETSDSSVRRALLERAERQMLSDYPVIPIYYYGSRRLVKPYLKGLVPNPLNRIYSKHLFIDANEIK